MPVKSGIERLQSASERSQDSMRCVFFWGGGGDSSLIEVNNSITDFVFRTFDQGHYKTACRY